MGADARRLGKIDAWGYDSLWAFDHFYPIFTPDPAGPCMENWTLLSALSQHTRRARIGALVNSNTYRNPCLTVKMAATLDHVSGGRLNLGLGAGWYELEHRSFGVDFKTVRGRLEALDESCQIIKEMFTQDRTTVEGKHYHVVDAVCNPKPLQKPHIPLMIGGRGEKSLLKIVAKHADMWNTMHANPAEMKRLIEIEKTIMMPLCYKASKEREQVISGVVASMARRPWIKALTSMSRIKATTRSPACSKAARSSRSGTSPSVAIRWIMSS